MDEHRLFIDEILTIGFVDKGDDPEAEIVFFKRKEEAVVEDKRSLVQKLLGALGFKEKEIGKLLAGGADGSGDDDGLNQNGGRMTFDIKKLDDEQKAVFDAAVAAAVKAEIDGDDDGDVIEMSPEIAKRFEAMEGIAKAAEERAEEAEKTVNKLHDEKERMVYIRKVSELDLPGAVADDFAEILRKADGALTDDERVKFNEVLKSASEAIKEGSLLKEAGVSSSDTFTGVEGEVVELVKVLRTADPTLSEEIARGQVWNTRPDLYKRYRDERDETINRAGG